MFGVGNWPPGQTTWIGELASNQSRRLQVATELITVRVTREENTMSTQLGVIRQEHPDSTKQMPVGRSHVVFSDGQVLEFTWGRGCTGHRRMTSEQIKEEFDLEVNSET